MKNKAKRVEKKAKVVKVKDFDSMTVSQVMEKEVQYVRLRTKGDVIASLMIEGFEPCRLWRMERSWPASSANMTCWQPSMTVTASVSSPRTMS